MSLDISKITDEALKTKAKQYDKDNNEILSNEEINQAGGMSVFEGINNEAIVQEDTFKGTQVLSVKEQNIAVLEALAYYIDRNGLSDNLMDMLETKFKDNTDYADDVEMVRQLLNKIKEEGYDSKEDIDKLKAKKKSLQNQVDKGNEVASSYQKIYDKIIRIAENDVINKEVMEIHDIYLGMERSGNYSKDSDNLKKELQNRKLWKTSYYKDAYDVYKKMIKSEANDIAKRNMNADHSTEKGSDIRDLVKNVHEKSHGGKDKVFNNAVDDNKDISDAIARHNKFNRRKEELKTVSADTLRDALGDSLLRKLDPIFLASHKNDDGTFDVSELSDKMLEAVGYDIMMNRTQDEKTSEMFNARYKIAQLLKAPKDPAVSVDQISEEDVLKAPEDSAVPVDQISEEDVKKIMKFCEVPMEPKERKILDLKDAGEDAAIGGLAGGLGALSAGGVHKFTLPVDVPLNPTLIQEINVIFQKYGVDYVLQSSSTTQQLPEIIRSANIPLNINFSDFINELAGVGLGVGAALITHIAMDLIFGKEQPTEKSIISLSDEGRKFDSLKEYSEFVTAKYPQQAAGLILLATVFTEKGTDKLDSEKLYHFYDLMAGEGSHLNYLEGQMASLRGERPKIKPESKVEVTKQVTKKPKPEEEPYDNTYIHKREYGDTWAGLIKAYYPDLKIQDVQNDPRLWGKNGLIRKFKRALAVDENGNYNPEIYKKLLNETELPKNIKIPSEFEGVKRVTGNEIDKGAHRTQTKDERYTGTSLNTVGRDEKGVNVKTVMIDGATVYTATDIEGDHKGCTASGDSKEQAIENLAKLTGETYTVIEDKTGDKEEEKE